MNKFLFESIINEQRTIPVPVVGRLGKKKSCFIDHNDHIAFENDIMADKKGNGTSANNKGPQIKCKKK